MLQNDVKCTQTDSQGYNNEDFRGKQTGTFRVTKGGLIVFALDILAPTLKNGFKWSSLVRQLTSFKPRVQQ